MTPPVPVTPPVAMTPPVPVTPPVAMTPPVPVTPPVAMTPPVPVTPPVAGTPPVPMTPPVAGVPPVPGFPPVATVPPVPPRPPTLEPPVPPVAEMPPVPFPPVPKVPPVPVSSGPGASMPRFAQAATVRVSRHTCSATRAGPNEGALGIAAVVYCKMGREFAPANEASAVGRTMRRAEARAPSSSRSRRGPRDCPARARPPGDT